jgi:cobalt-zinc-cadmium efflux system outer membrane protein
MKLAARMRGLCALVSMFGALRATAAAEPLRLTMDEVVQRALAAGQDTASLEHARAQLERSKAWLPANPFFGAGGGTNSQQNTPANYLFFLSQEVEIAGQRRARMAAAESGVEQASWSQRSAENDVMASAKTTFVRVLAAAARVTIAEENLEAAAEVLQAAPGTRASDEERVERNTATAQEVRARRELAVAEQLHADALGSLRQITGIPAMQALELVGALRTEAAALPPPTELIERAHQTRADLIALRHAVDTSAHEVDLQSRERIPNVTLFGSVSRFENDTLVGGDIGVPLPIFQSGTPAVQEAAAERSRMERELRSLERSIDTEVLEAHRACAVAAGSLQAYQAEILPRLRENLEIEQRLYRHGKLTLSELIGYRLELLSARREHIDILEAYNAALIELERVVGGKLDAPTPAK